MDKPTTPEQVALAIGIIIAGSLIFGFGTLVVVDPDTADRVFLLAVKVAIALVITVAMTLASYWLGYLISLPAVKYFKRKREQARQVERILETHAR